MQARAALLALLGLTALVGLAQPASAYEKEISDQAEAIAEKLADSDIQTLAVVDFTDLQGNVTELGRFLAEELSIGLAGLDAPDGDFEVVDRTHLKAILKEHKLSATGLIDPSTAREVGQIAGVGALIAGTVTPLGEDVRLAVKVLDTESARIVTSTTTNIPYTPAIQTLRQREIGSGRQASVQPVDNDAPSSSTSVTEYGYHFQLKRCTLSGETLVCTVTVTNRKEDCELTIYASNFQGHSRAIDLRGRQFEASLVELGGQSSPFFLTEMAVQGIPTGLRFIFQDVPSDISGVALLEVTVDADGSCNQSGSGQERFRAQLRDLPVSRE